MELVEKIETINDWLVRNFGMEANINQPMFRVVFSEDQYEKRLTDCTPEGLSLLQPEIQLLPKYKQWIHERYILERLVVVPDVNLKEVAGVKLSYEPIWIFETQLGAYLPPRIDVCKIVIDSLYAALGKKSMRKYVDPDATKSIEERHMEIDALQRELFGNETATGDALAYKTGVTVPGPSTKSVIVP